MSRLGIVFTLLSLLAFSSLEARDPRLDSVPVSFEENRGQAPGEILFSARGKSGLIGLTRSAIIFPADGARLRFQGAEAAVVKGTDPRTGRVNYLLGNEPSKWRANVPTFGAVEYGRLYPGVDMVVHGRGGEVQYDFFVAPYADPKRIAFAIDRAKGSAPLRIGDEGDLIIPIGHGGEARVRRPYAYQEIDGERARVEASYQIRDRREVGFRLGAYDKKRPLIIDPVLSYSTYLGGTSDEEENAIAVDSSGNIYIAGSTKSSDFPVTSGVAQPAFGGRGSFGGDAYVIKYDPTGNRIVYATYLGGSGDDNAHGIAVDSSGRAYVTGATDSKNFPLSQPFQGTFGGSTYDSFITRLSADGSALSYSSYLGGSGNDLATAVTVDSSGNAYIAGYTFSTNFPNTNGFQTSFAGRIFDAFLTKVNAAGLAVAYSTYLGGNTYDLATAVAVDASNNAYVTGFTFSSNFPTKAALQGTIAAGNCNSGGSSSNCADAFVAKINTAGSGSASLVYSTFLGGGKNDYGNAIAVDSTGSVYIAGTTDSTNFPTVSPLQAANAGYYDTFVAKLNPSGSALVYSTYFGGIGYDEITALRVDGSGRAFVFGSTASQDFPLKSAFQAAHGGGSSALLDKTVAAPPGGSTFALITIASDAFVARIETSGSTLGYASYLGGSGDELAYGLALEGPNVWVSGQTDSTNFRTVSPVQAALKGGSDLFFSRIAGFGLSGISPTFGPTAGGTRVTVAGEGLLSGATLTLGGVAATGLSVTSTSISGTTGAHPAGTVNVDVRNPDGEQSTLAAAFFYTDAPLPSLSLTPSSQTIESGLTSLFIATLTAAQTSDVSVALSASSSQFVQIPASVTIPTGSTSQAFSALGLAAGGPTTITGKLPPALGGQTSNISVTVIAATHTPRRRPSRQ
jgi:IPT/TIG domain./Beta-propeller repeat.